MSYPLASRGLVAITGRNDDDESSESNGAGKTSLLTALLWAMKVGPWEGANPVVHLTAHAVVSCHCLPPQQPCPLEG